MSGEETNVSERRSLSQGAMLTPALSFVRGQTHLSDAQSETLWPSLVLSDGLGTCQGDLPREPASDLPEGLQGWARISN